jgi:hypothetical protein
VLHLRAPAAEAPARADARTGAGARQRRPHRLARVLAPFGLALLIAVLIVALTSGSSQPAPPATGTAALVPADALVYLHLSTDPHRAAVRRLDALLAALPDHGSAVLGLGRRFVDVVAGRATASLATIRPWLGREAAFALLNSPGASAGSVILLAVRDRSRALAFIERAGARGVGRDGGHALYRYPTGAELAFAGRYLVVGQDAGVRAALALASGHGASLQKSPLYEQAAAGEPDGRVLDAYLSAGGIGRVLLAQSGVLGELGTLLAHPGLRATTITLTPQAPGLAVRIHTVLDPHGAPARPASFTPTLQDVLPGGSTLMLDVHDLAQAAPGVLNAMAQIGLYSALPNLLHRLGLALTQQGYNVQTLLSLFSGETALALVTGSGAPALVLVTRTRDEQAARLSLAGLVAPLTQIFAPPASGPGIEPSVSSETVDGASVDSVQLGPGLQFDWTVFRGLVVLSTSLRGIGDVVSREGTLGAASGFRSVLGQRPSRVTSLGFADFSQLLSLGEQTTLARGAGYQGLLPDLRRIRASGFDSTRGEDDMTAELLLQIP